MCRLVLEGKAYPCFCTDEEIAQMKAQAEAESRPPVYIGRWAHASPEEVEQEKAKVKVSSGSWHACTLTGTPFQHGACQERTPQALMPMEAGCAQLLERWCQPA